MIYQNRADASPLPIREQGYITMHTNDASTQWEQLSFDKAPVYELLIRVGLVPESDHAQIQIECHDATRGELIALSSWPHLDPFALEARLQDALAEFYALVRRYSGPFPD
jgi:hypothetical protein